MTEVIRDVVVNIRLRQLDIKLKAPDTRAVTTAIARVDKQVDASSLHQVKSAKKRFAEIAKAEREAAKARQKEAKAAAKEAAENAKKIVEGQFKAADGFKSIGDNALQMAQTLGGLFFESSEDLKQFNRHLQFAGQGFDLLKNGIDIVKGSVSVFTGLSSAGKAAAAANTATAAGNTAVATTATSATTATRGLSAALGPIGLALAAAGAAYAAYVAWQKKSKRASEEEAKAERDKAKSLKDSSRRKLEEITARRGESGLRILRAGHDEGERFEKLQLRIDKHRGGLSTEELTKRELAAVERLRKQLHRQRARAFRQSFQRGEAGYSNQGLHSAEQIFARGGKSINSGDQLQALQAAKQLAFYRSRERRLLESKLTILSREKQRTAELIAEQRKSLDVQKAAFELAKQSAEEHRKTVNATKAGIGRMNPRDRARLERIADKVRNQKQLDRREVEFAEQHGGHLESVRHFVQNYYAGRDGGAADRIITGFGGRPLQGPKSRAASLKKNVEKERERLEATSERVMGNGDTQGTIEKIKAKAEETAKAEAQVLDLLRTLVSRDRQMQHDVAELKNKIDQREMAYQ